MADVVNIKARKPETLDQLFVEAHRRGVTKAILVGVDEHGKPYCNATGNAMISELAWFAMMADDAVRDIMKAD